MNNKIFLSPHADHQGQKRGISDSLISFAYLNGERKEVYGGRQSYTLTDRNLKALPPCHKQSCLRGLRIIVADDIVVTVYHANSVARRPNINRRALLLEKVRLEEDKELIRQYRS